MTTADKGDGWACNIAGNVYYYGNGVKQDFKNAKLFFQKGCDLDDANACYNLAVYIKLWWDENNYQRKIFVYQNKSCRLGNLKMCVNAGMAYFIHEPNPNFEVGLNFFRKACDKNYADGCTWLGIMHFDQGGKHQNFRKSIKFFDKGCKLGASHSCFSQGYQYYYGLAVKRDVKKANTLFDKACKLNKYNCDREQMFRALDRQAGR